MTKFIIASGIGFSPGHVKYIVGRGLIPAPLGTVFGPEGRAVVLRKERRSYVVFRDKRSFQLKKERRSADKG